MSVPRKLTPGDLDRVAAHLFRLDSRSRCERFSGRVSDESIAAYVESIRPTEDLLLGWFEEGELRASVHLAMTRSLFPREAELALTVEAAWQDRGIGTSLCRDALQVARNRLVGRVWLICLMENVRMQRIVRKLDGRVLYLDGEAEGQITLPPPDSLSLWHEAFGDGGALVETLIDQWRPAGFAPEAAPPASAAEADTAPTLKARSRRPAA